MMKIEDNIIIEYLNENRVERYRDHWIFDRIEEGRHCFDEPDSALKDKIRSLYLTVKDTLENFSPFNRELFGRLFPSWEEAGREQTVLLAVGCPKPYDALTMSRNQIDYIILDLIRFQDYIDNGSDAVYKKMEIADITDLSDLYIGAFNAPPWNDNWTRETAGKRLHQMICVEDFYGLCAYQEEQLCGMILGCMEQFYDGMTFNLREFCIRNGLRGNGIGSQMIGYLEEELKEMGVTEIILFTSRGMATEHFYQKQGYHNLDSLVMMGKRIQ